jgi:hypothetical protein
MDDPQIHRLRVINRNEFIIRDRYDGVPYNFVPDEYVDLPLDAAQHILGYPAERDVMNLHMAKRWGWNRPEHVVIDPHTKKMKFQELADNIRITVETFEIRRVVDPAARLDDPPLPPDLTEDELAEARSTLGKPKKWGNLPAAPGERG